MEIVGHRGACGRAPENTLRSFAQAIELGCHRAELDVQVSADGIAVVLHDATVDRTTDGHGAVSAFNLQQLKQLDAGAGEKIPTLEEVMALCRHRIALQIELKAQGSPALVAALIERAWDPEKTVITSFDLGLLDAFASLMPSIPLGLLNRDAELDMIAVASAHRHRWICPRVDITTADLIARAHGSAFKVYVYHVNRSDEAAALIRWGVDAIGTDHPGMVAGLLASQSG
jgi:glycerophosphoryl diester phosphodiesterase